LTVSSLYSVGIAAFEATLLAGPEKNEARICDLTKMKVVLVVPLRF
jgi:hypothetical protein